MQIFHHLMAGRIISALHSGKVLFCKLVNPEPVKEEKPKFIRISIGDHTYGHTESTFINPFDSSDIVLGKYCSLAQGVKIISASGRHSFDCISTYPLKCTLDPKSIPVLQLDKDDLTTRIGNDVWLGLDSIVMPCVKIGNGAVVGARSVVTHDVPAYAVIAGNPARIIRYRFTPEQIVKLERIAWWDWSDEKIERCGNDFYLGIDEFLKKHAVD
jgi:virginiamycin A acetyltransferase